MKKEWLQRSEGDQDKVKIVQDSLKVSPLIAELLLHRGIDSFEKAKKFFRPEKSHLHDPFLMLHMDVAVHRLQTAIVKQEKVMIYGDYDVDGTTAVALVFGVLQTHLTQIEYYIPDRYAEGYGVSSQGIQYAKDHDFTLIITLDCGIKAVEQATMANQHGIDMIICDHHEPGVVLPPAIILDPKQKNCLYPFKELSGCGVGFKLLQGLFQKNEWDDKPLFEQTDLLALSIAADIVQVLDENRVLAYLGLQQFNANPRPAFLSLLSLAKKQLPLTLTDLVFVLAPRINAAGRLSSGKTAVQLMVEGDPDLIDAIANEINVDNTNRRALDKDITAHALQLLEEDPEFNARKSTVVFHPSWHKGVVGIVASRLIEKHFKPTIVLTESNGMVTGSARTVNDFDIHAALCACEDLLEQFGGHTHAAGLSLLPENLVAFQERFEEVVQRSIKEEDLLIKQHIDASIHLNQVYLPGESFDKIPRFMRVLQEFEPFGPGNMKPVFLFKQVYSHSNLLLKEAHLKLKIQQVDSLVKLDAIGFNMAEHSNTVSLGLAYDLACTFETSTFRDKTTLQLMIKDLRPTD